MIRLKCDYNTYKEIYGGDQPSPIDYIPQAMETEWKKSNPDEMKPARIVRDDIPKELAYKRNRQKKASVAMEKVCHNGQRKLFLTEIQHLNKYIDDVNEELYIIYAGAAPSNKAWIYAKMFPGIKFIFIDPNEFLIYINGFHNTHYYYPGKDVVYMSVSGDNVNPKYMADDDKHPRSVKHYLNDEILDKKEVNEFIGWEEDSMIDFIQKSDHRFYLFEERMTMEVSQSLNRLIKNEKKVLFWSDIRTNIREAKYPGDIDVIANAAMNYVWMKTLVKDFKGEFYSMLKFRLPYFEDSRIDWADDIMHPLLMEAKELGCDFKKAIMGKPLLSINEEKRESGKVSSKSMPWFKGEIYLQAFAGIHSAESRLWSTLEDINSDLIDWQLKEHEDKLYYFNTIERFGCKFENKFADERYGFDHCGDCAIEATVWDDFFTKFKIFEEGEKRQLILDQVKELGDITGRPLNRYPHGKQF